MTAAARRVLDDIAAGVDWALTGRVNSGSLEIRDGPAAIASLLPVSDIAAGAYGALALAAATLHARRGGDWLCPFVDQRRAGLAMAGNEYLAVNGAAPQSWDPITGCYRCADGWLYLHANFPHLRDGLLALFGAEATRPALAARLQEWRAAEAEEKAQARGLCAMRLRTPAEWEAHPQRAALAARRLIATRPGGDANLLPPAGTLPLSGVRVLDLSRVIAGPMAGRALSELGADVLRVSAPHLSFVEPLVIDTGFGKRNACIDLREEAGRATLRALVSSADVIIDAYRPGALAAKGFGAQEARALNPRLVHIGLSAFDTVGPWAGRRGYDSYIQAGTGFTAPDEPGAAPMRLACQPLDYLTGCLGAFAAVIGLLRRMEGAGGAAATLSLARTAIWLRDMAGALGPEATPPARNPDRDAVDAEGAIFGTESDFGAVRALAPPYGFKRAALRLGPPRRLGADAPIWLQELPA